MGNVLQFPLKPKGPDPLWLLNCPPQAYAAVRINARRLTAEAVKAQLQAEGQRLTDYTVGEIRKMAEAYLAQHHELLAKSIEQVQ